MLFILGISATIAPLAASAQLVRFDVPVMIFVSMLMWVMASNRTIGRGEGVVLLAAMIGYTALLICLGKRRGRHDPPVAADLQGVPLAPSTHPLISVLWVLIGLGLLVLGARWLVDGAVDLALMLGVSELMIGLTIVAAGTSSRKWLPPSSPAFAASGTLRWATWWGATFTTCLPSGCRRDRIARGLAVAAGGPSV